MKVNIRKGVFETNSSSTHTFSFTLGKLGKPSKNSDVFIAKGVKHKFEVVSFLIAESDERRYFISTIGGVSIRAHDFFGNPLLSKKNTELIDTVCKIIGLKDFSIKEERDSFFLEDQIAKYIYEREQFFFRRKDYQYPIYFYEKDGKDVVDDELNDDERTTLALKYLLFHKSVSNCAYESFDKLDYFDRLEKLLSDLYSKDEEARLKQEIDVDKAREEKCKTLDGFSEEELEGVFFEILNKRITPKILPVCDVLFSSQVIDIDLLERASEEVVKGLIKTPFKYELMLEGLLDDYYPFYTLTQELDIDCMSIEIFKESLTKFLTDESITVEIE